MKLLLSIIIFSAVAINIKAQDYVITTNGDSIPCKISVPLLGGALRYQTDGTSKAVIISGETVKVYYWAKQNQLYHLVFINDMSHPHFMTFIEKGKLDLYEAKYNVGSVGFQTSASAWFIGKGSCIVHEVKAPALSGITVETMMSNFVKAIRDNPDVYNKFVADRKFTNKAIRNLVHLYNTGEPYDEHAQTLKAHK